MTSQTGSLTRYALLHAAIFGNYKIVIPPNWPIDPLRLWPDRRLSDALSKRPPWSPRFQKFHGHLDSRSNVGFRSPK